MFRLYILHLYVVPTEYTDHTEAYGLKVLESTERIDAARHTTEDTELIACVASPKLSMVRRLWRRKALVLVSPLLVIPTECTDHTEAYGLKVLESTERIDATRHTTEITLSLQKNATQSHKH